MVAVDKNKYIARSLIHTLWMLCLLCFGLQAQAAVDIERQRELFRQAEQALADNDATLFARLSEQLKDYPLQPYLQYDALKKRLRQADISEVEKFLQQHREYPFHYHLLSQWLDILADREDWQNYLRFYDDRSATRYKCLALNARLQTGQVEDINQQIKPIWLSGYSQPKACDKPFAHFLDNRTMCPGGIVAKFKDPAAIPGNPYHPVREAFPNTRKIKNIPVGG